MEEDFAAAKELQTKEEETESGLARAWRYWRIVWKIIQTVIYIWIVFLAFERMNSVFETLALAALVLILQSVGNSFTLFFRIYVEESIVHRRLFLGLYKKFDDPDIADAESSLREAEQRHLKSTVLWYINIAGSSIVYLFVLWKIINTLVLQ